MKTASNKLTKVIDDKIQFSDTLGVAVAVNDDTKSLLPQQQQKTSASNSIGLLCLKEFILNQVF